MHGLNWLRKHRMQSDQYVELSAVDTEEALDWVIKERRKELVLRGIRWEDLRRFSRPLAETVRVGNYAYVYGRSFD